MPPLQLVTFDMTGTLLLFKTPVIQQYAAAAAKFGLKADPLLIQTNFKKAWKTLTVHHPNFGKNTGLGWQTWWQTIVLETFKHTTENSSLLPQVAKHLIQHFETSDAWCIAEGGIQLLDDLQSQGLTLGVISNFDPRLHTIMKNLSISKYFSFVLTSYEAGFAKPDRRIFEEALRRAGGVVPANALHIGNDRKLDFDGAVDLGIHAVLLSEAPEATFPTEISNIADVVKCINIINNT